MHHRHVEGCKKSRKHHRNHVEGCKKSRENHPHHVEGCKKSRENHPHPSEVARVDARRRGRGVASRCRRGRQAGRQSALNELIGQKAATASSTFIHATLKQRSIVDVFTFVARSALQRLSFRSSVER
eukprot:1301972-Pleurochrysis_carterae.AAC.1